MQNTCKQPLIIEQALQRLDERLSSTIEAHTPPRCRAMRCERRTAIASVAAAALRAACLQADGLFVRLMPDGKEAAPLTVAALASRAGIGERRTKRALYDMRQAGLLQVKPQRIHHDSTGGGIIVAACLRQFTRRFWAALGLYQLYVDTVKYMQKKPLIKLRYAAYRIRMGVEKIVTALTTPQRNQPPPKTTDAAAWRCLTQNKGRCVSPNCPAKQARACAAMLERLGGGLFA